MGLGLAVGERPVVEIGGGQRVPLLGELVHVGPRRPVALLPIAMAADSCTSSSTALLCTGLPQLVALVVIGLGVLGAVVVAALGARRGGWGALAHALGGWLTLATSLVLAGLVLWAST